MASRPNDNDTCAYPAPVSAVERSGLGHLPALLLGALRDHFDDAEIEYSTQPGRVRGGQFSSVLGFELSARGEGLGSFVVRLLGNDSDQARLEAGLHNAAQAEGLAAPRVVLWEPADSRLGEAYLVMERLPGRTYLRGAEPSRVALDLPKLLVAWPRQLVVVLSALGRVDVERARAALQETGVPDDLLAPGRHLRQVTAALVDEIRLHEMLDWLHEGRPDPPASPALVHGDLWPGNVFMTKPEVCLIDWTRGGIDDPALDVGFAKSSFALMPEPLPPPPPINVLGRLAGRAIASGISARCDDLVGGTNRVRYYEALRCAVELADIVTGRTKDEPVGWSHGVGALVSHLEGMTGLTINFT
jgi:aminoglycoside phosphotransferase (APT) family kinase protein